MKFLYNYEIASRYLIGISRPTVWLNPLSFLLKETTYLNSLNCTMQLV